MYFWVLIFVSNIFFQKTWIIYSYIYKILMSFANTQFKLSQIVQIVNNTFEELFGESEFLFTAEVMKISIISTKIYIELVEFDENNKILAKSRAIVYNLSIYDNFVNETSISHISDLKWLKLLFTWQVTFHPEYGFSIKITKIHSEYILWQLIKKEQKIIDQLTKDWILHQNKQTSIWLPPYHIAIISSESSQWFEDFRSIINNSKYNIKYSLYPTHIHGNIAILSVYNNLKQIYIDIKNKINYSVVAIIRWGGWSSGISWQNDINIAKGVCHMPVPVILAIWHTSDQFVLDQIAKYAMKTPSDAAHFLINQINNLTDDIWAIYHNINNIINAKKQSYISSIEYIYQQIFYIINKQKSQIITNINQYNKNIKSFDLWFMTARGFAIIKKNDEYLSKKILSDLKKWDQLTINIYDYEFDVIVK